MRLEILPATSLELLSTGNYVEDYLDALEKVQSFHERNPNTSIGDICFALKISMRTTIVSGAGGIHIPDDLTSFPSTAQLLRG